MLALLVQDAVLCKNYYTGGVTACQVKGGGEEKSKHAPFDEPQGSGTRRGMLTVLRMFQPRQRNSYNRLLR
jgi:hypothetical protein